VAVFEAQISTQVAQGMKDAITDMLAADKASAAGVQVSEADVIREAIGVGLGTLEQTSPTERVERYARRRRGMS